MLSWFTLFTKLHGWAYAGTIMNLQIVLNTPKKFLLKSCYTPPPPPKKKKKKNLATIFLPQKIPTSKISKPQKSFDHPCHFKSGVPALGLRHLCSIFTETGPKSPFSCVRRALSKTAFHFLCQRKSYPVLYCRHSLIQGEILQYNNIVEHILVELAICKMATFYYCNQHPF